MSEYTLDTPIGKFTGLEVKDPVSGDTLQYRYAQIPYSGAIVGKQRFKKPTQLPADHDYSGKYTELGLPCPQPFVSNENLRKVMPQVKGDENINYLNIWIPSHNEQPEGGFPVLVYIHGGWLQYGNPSDFGDPLEMQSGNTLRKYIIVTPGYRLNVLGFLNSTELSRDLISNVGFWDQRLAIEWVYDNIKHFGGNPEKITVGGLSAGSYSTFFQLAYELYNHKTVRQIIKQVVHFSNAILVQPKHLSEVDEQYEDLLTKLGIDLKLPTEEKLARLQSVDVHELMDILSTLKVHTFRAVSDDVFVSLSLTKDLNSGIFAAKIQEVKGPDFRIVIGEASNEAYLYSVLDTPKNEDELIIQLENYYPKKVVVPLRNLYGEESASTTSHSAEYYETYFGRIVSDGQVYASSRGYIKNLVDNGFPKLNLFRYRVAYRPKYLDKVLDPSFGVIHGMDLAVWFVESGATESEKALIETFISPFNDILSFVKENNWGTLNEKQYRYLSSTGETKVLDDEDWEWGVKVSNTVFNAQ